MKTGLVRLAGAGVRAGVLAGLLAAPALPALAQNSATTDYSTILTPAKPGWPLAHPIATTTIAPPPLSLMADRPVNPAYVPGLPGLPQGRAVSDDFGRKPLKYDAVFIRKSRVENDEIVIPPGGLAYLEDTWGGEVALRGEIVPVLGRMPTFIDYDMTTEVQENVTIPAGGSVVVGGQVYHYYASVGHEKMANHSLHVRTIAGTDWEWAFGAPQFSASETNWWGSNFAQLYNQGHAREVSGQKLVFDWISGVRTLDVLTGDTVTASRTLGPVRNELLIEDTTARKALVFEDGDMVAFLSPFPAAFAGGKANLKVYGQAFSLAYGSDYARDARFAVYPVGCPTGHNFGFMLVNKHEIRIKPGQSVEGPEGYFKVVVDRIENGTVAAWHVADKEGNRSINLGGPEVANIDLVLGQGRVAGQA
ncbi:MAG: hypothetical protein B7Z52_01550, partial [Burkholderiales bacterium 12-64-5]